jgi:excisionase family DNA binding protein
MNRDNPLPKRCYSLQELARALGVSRGFIYKEITAGRLLKTKLGTRTVFTKEEIDRYLAERTSEARMHSAASNPSIMTMCVGGHMSSWGSSKLRSARIENHLYFRALRAAWAAALTRFRSAFRHAEVARLPWG